LSLSSSKTSLVHDLFVRTADENYVTARWCAGNRLDTDFSWLAVHALEKYMKAVLLLNGHSSKKNGHDIVQLYAQIKDTAGSLLPEVLTKPEDLDTANWLDRSATSFIQHLLNQGNADNRYLIYGYNTRREDLYMLDQMVFVVQRLICPLDERAIRSHFAAAPTLTHRELLTRQPDYYGRLYMPLDCLIATTEDSPARTTALNLNLWFAPTDFQHTPERNGSSSHHPVIVRRVLDPLGSDDPREAAQGIEVAHWLFDNVVIPGYHANVERRSGVARQITEAINSAQAKHGLP